ncbi:MAG: WGR domain-containing protein, partial [Myxococcales bacterium]|nr:WGR domain-containing protein [Myxococcales bacterium]
MPRFESEDRFWEIERDGRKIRIRWGLLGEDGEQTVRVEHFVAVAKRQFEEAIEAKLAEGYVQVEDVGLRDLCHNPSLEGRVVEELDPDSDGSAASIAWVVLGDWLSARGDVRGELIAIDEMLARRDDMSSSYEHAQLERRRRALLEAWVPRWLGDLASLCGPGRPLELQWDHGWIAGVRMGTAPGRLDLSDWRLGLRDLVPVLEYLLEHPLVWMCRKITLAELDPRGRRDYSIPLGVLAVAPRRTLVRLELGDFTEGEWARDQSGNYRPKIRLSNLGPLEPLAGIDQWAPRLRALRLVGRQLGALPPMPQLRALEMLVPTLTLGVRGSLIRNPWPRLERLWIRCVEVYDPWSREQLGDGTELRGLLASLSSASLRELGVQGPTAVLAVLELADRLRLRELRLHRISESTARLILDHAERLRGV